MNPPRVWPAWLLLGAAVAALALSLSPAVAQQGCPNRLYPGNCEPSLTPDERYKAWEGKPRPQPPPPKPAPMVAIKKIPILPPLEYDRPYVGTLYTQQVPQAVR
jgi:hypothetical protein